VIVTAADNVPVNLRIPFCDCVGPALGVAVNPAGEVSITFELVRLIVARPPNMPSIADKSGLIAAEPHVPGRSPVLGTIRPLFTVVGSVN
jgi:hypothetical protein